MFHVSVLLLWLGYFVLFLWSNHQIQIFHIKAAIQIPVHVSLLVELLFVAIKACHESAACWTEAFWHFAGCAGTAAGPRHCTFRELCGASAAYRGVSATVKKMETSSKFRRTIKAGDRSTDDSEKIPQKMHMKSYNISIYHIQFFICEICSSLIFRMYHNASWKETSEINGKSWQGYYCTDWRHDFNVSFQNAEENQTFEIDAFTISHCLMLQSINLMLLAHTYGRSFASARNKYLRQSFGGLGPCLAAHVSLNWQRSKSKQSRFETWGWISWISWIMSYLKFWSACEGIDVWSCANSHLGAWWNHEAGDTASGELTGSDGKNCASCKLLCLYNCLVVFNSTAQFNFFAELRQDNGTICFYLWARWTIFCKGSRSLGQNYRACKEWLQVCSLIYLAGWQWDRGSRDSSHWRGYRFYFLVAMSETCSVEVSKQTCTFCSTQAWHKQNTSYSEQN